MGYYLLKLLLSAGIIVTVSEVAKVNAGLGALIKSLPLVSILAMIWLYVDTSDRDQIAELSVSTEAFMPEHRGRATRLMERHGSMMGGM